MATTTTNFGWDIPQSTDLVKDGATAIAALGQDIDTSMAELKGGTTGQVLSKTSNTDMDFTWTSPTTGDITGVTAGTGLTGGGTSGDVTVSIDPTYYLLANQTRRNPVLNSNMSVWQRGTSIAGSTTAFSADRWQSYRGVAGSTFSRQTTGDTTNLPNIQYCTRIQRDSGNTSTSSIFFWQNFETVNSIPFAGKSITLSFYARKGANYSQATNLLDVTMNSGTGTDQNGLTSTFTGQASVIGSTATLTTTWQRFTFTGTIAASATQIGLGFSYTPAGTAGAADYYEITGVQLEVGSTANGYAPNGATYQQELAACQRYYFRNTADTNQNLTGFAVAAATTTAICPLTFPVPMRVAPTSLDSSNLRYANYGGSTFNMSSVYYNQASPVAAQIVGTISGGTAGVVGSLLGAATGSYFGFNAEL